MPILVTGAAGFIGFHVARALCQRGETVVGIDNLNDYYDPALKEARLAVLADEPGFHFERLDLADRVAMEALFAIWCPERVVHLAAQAGVRYSLENPHAYVESNLVGFLHVLEGCRTHRVAHLTYASSSSVYGGNVRTPFAVEDRVDHPLSLYAATKKANELMAHSYSHLYDLPTTGLRFFTVYGPWGRPDMALFTFTRKILAGEPIEVFNHGHHRRDFTYIDDIVEGVLRVHDQAPTEDPSWRARATEGDIPAASSSAPWRLYNIGNQTPVPLIRYIEVLEQCLGRQAVKHMLPRQPGDALDTHADVSALQQAVGYCPSTSIEVGVQRFVEWYRAFYEAPEAAVAEAIDPLAAANKVGVPLSQSLGG
ncbi:NAD-dependent epimerase [Halomonas heilongjiangensis]|uniref:Capsular biosynthesis protein CpsI n=1 Tax=Halomonas heilongjiangensis TaxID=1387883 RepID=A0A2N7TME7_9GAMM|nr:NAD-dependent epimerase [Halomonas heilongjiangensis]PMR69366.1 capsular biosynthesis protein CpsI [Halomonas heilongjiangensis]PXX90629.1 capsular biosynthesis protein CpsI [Halomonas heilongjiangensis]